MSDSFKIADRVELVAISQLKANPLNKEVHPDFDPAGRDSWMVKDVAEHGVLMPILTDGDGKILDGHKRVFAVEKQGGSHVPRIRLDAGEDSAFASAQLHRELSMHAKCVLYRERIEALVEAGKRKRALSNSPFARKTNESFSREGEEDCKDELEESWIELEQVLGKRRDYLQRGVALLARIDEWRQSNKPKLARRAGVIASTFRNRGLVPALRLADEPVDTSEAEDDGPPGQESWPKLERKPAKKKKEQQVEETQLSGDVSNITDADRWAFVQEAVFKSPVYQEACEEAMGGTPELWFFEEPFGNFSTFTEAVDAAIQEQRANANSNTEAGS